MRRTVAAVGLTLVFAASATAGALTRATVLGSAGTSTTAAGGASAEPGAAASASAAPSGAAGAPGAVVPPAASAATGASPESGCGATWPLPAQPTARVLAADARRAVPVLTYHRIVSPADATGSLAELLVPPDLFEMQLRTLVDAGWHSITAAELAADLASGRRPARKSFVITIDDGWPDGATNAAPILRRLGLVATFYVITGRVGRKDELTAVQLCDLARAGNEIGSHSVGHLSLPRLASDDVTAQLTRSADEIVTLVGRPPATLSYPYGGVDAAVAGEASAAGYALAFTTVSGCTQSPSTRFLAPRLRVGPGTTPAVLLADVTACAGR